MLRLFKSSYTTFYKECGNNCVHSQRFRQFFNNFYIIIFPYYPTFFFHIFSGCKITHFFSNSVKFFSKKMKALV